MSNTSLCFGCKRPSLSNLISGTSERIYKSCPPEGGPVSIHDYEDTARFRDAMGLPQGFKQAVLVVCPGLLLSSLSIGRGDALLLLWRQLAGEMLWIEKPDGWP